MVYDEGGLGPWVVMISICHMRVSIQLIRRTGSWMYLVKEARLCGTFPFTTDQG